MDLAGVAVVIAAGAVAVFTRPALSKVFVMLVAAGVAMAGCCAAAFVNNGLNCAASLSCAAWSNAGATARPCCAAQSLFATSCAGVAVVAYA